MIKKQLYINRILLLICISIYSNFSFAQSCGPLTLDSIQNPGIYNVATLTETDNIRNGPDYAGATIYYPTNATPPYTSIVIVPGYVSAQSTIQSWGPFLASHGIVTMTIGTNSIFENPEDRKNALLDAIKTLKVEDSRQSSPLLGKLDTNRMAVSGWSMGGGGAQLAAVADTTLKAVVALCPWLDVNLTAADLNHPVPLLIFSAEQDAIAPHASHADVHYNNTPQTTNKLLFEIENAGHTVANDPSGGQEYIGKIALSWLKKYLIGDVCYCPLLLDTPSTASKYLTNVVCPDSTSPISGISSAITLQYQLYPNPSSGSINLEVKNVDNQTHYEILSLDGVKISSGVILNEITNIDIQNLSSGVYLMNIVKLQTSEKFKFIVK